MIKDNDRITSLQMYIVIVSAINAIEVLSFPRELASKVGPDGWVVLVVGHMLAAVGLFFIIKLGMLFPHETFAEYAPRIAGSILGNAFVLLAVVFWVLITARITREFGDFVRLILDRTPIEMLILLFLLTAAYVVRHGIEPIVRVLEILFPVFILLVLVLVAVVLPTVDLSRFQPFLQTDFKTLGLTSGDTAIGLEGLEAFIMLLPFMIQSGDAYKAGFAALGTNLVLRLTIFVAAIATFGVQLTKTLVWPVEELSRTISLPGEFFSRMDAVFIALWVTVTFSSIVVYYYLGSLAFSRMLKFREHSLVVLPLLPIIFLLALFPENIIATEQYSQYVSILFGVIVYGVVPFLLVVTYIRGTHKQGLPGGDR